MSFQPLHVAVEDVDRPQHRRHLAGRVAVGVLGVMHERHPHRAVFGRDPRVGHPPRPRAAGDDRRLTRPRPRAPGVAERQRRRRGERRRPRAPARARPRRALTSTSCRRTPLERPRGAQLHARAVPRSTPDRPISLADGAGAVGAVAVRARRTPTRLEAPAGPRKRSSTPAAGRRLPLHPDQVRVARQLDRRGAAPRAPPPSALQQPPAAAGRASAASAPPGRSEPAGAPQRRPRHRRRAAIGASSGAGRSSRDPAGEHQRSDTAAPRRSRPCA